MSDNQERNVLKLGKYYSRQSLHQENLALRQQNKKLEAKIEKKRRAVSELKEILKDNDEIFNKFVELECCLAKANSIIDIFDTVFGRIEEFFSINNVWIVMIDGGRYTFDLSHKARVEQLYTRLCFYPEKEFLELLHGSDEPILVNENIRLYRKASPASLSHFVKSIALIPLTIDDEIVGSLNLGYHTKHRFSPDLDPIFLKMLGLKISFSLKMFLPRNNQVKIIPMKKRAKNN